MAPQFIHLPPHARNIQLTRLYSAQRTRCLTHSDAVITSHRRLSPNRSISLGSQTRRFDFRSAVLFPSQSMLFFVNASSRVSRRRRASRSRLLHDFPRFCQPASGHPAIYLGISPMVLNTIIITSRWDILKFERRVLLHPDTARFRDWDWETDSRGRSDRNPSAHRLPARDSAFKMIIHQCDPH